MSELRTRHVLGVGDARDGVGGTVACGPDAEGPGLRGVGSPQNALIRGISWSRTPATASSGPSDPDGLVR